VRWYDAAMAASGDKRRWRNPKMRQRVMVAAMAAIAEHGLADLRMAHITERTGMSHGHILYYFGSKQQILLESLRWSEEELAAERERMLAATEDPLERLRSFIDLSMLTGPRDPHWVLWLEIFARTPHDRGLVEFMLPYDLAWRDALERIVTDGIRLGTFATGDVQEFVAWFTALITGLSIDIVGDYPGRERDASAALAQHLALVTLGA
jgi:AcrR family transcriptional regulator